MDIHTYVYIARALYLNVCGGREAEYAFYFGTWICLAVSLSFSVYCAPIHITQRKCVAFMKSVLLGYSVLKPYSMELDLSLSVSLSR